MTQLSTPSSTSRDFLARPILTAIDLDWEKALYLVFILAAVVTHFWDLGSRVVSHDESLHTQYSYQFYNGDGYQHTPLMHGPSLFHATALSYWLFGHSDYTSRIPVALLGVLLVFMPYLLRDWIGHKGALLASFLVLISPYMTYYSRYIRHDIYVITFALIVFIAIQYYRRERLDKYLWWFAAGMGLMFATMETSFIYVAIFGSFLVLALAHRIWRSDWFFGLLPRLKHPAVLITVGLILLGGSFALVNLLPDIMGQINGAATATEDVFAADPTAETPAPSSVPLAQSEQALRWLQIAGIALLSAGLFMAANTMRPYIDGYAEFDLIVLFTTLVLPTAAAMLIYLVGWNPLDYSMNTCAAGAPWDECATAFLESGIVRSGAFLSVTLVVSILVGIWWDSRRWLIAAAIFHAIFAVLFTSLFTNPPGWGSGMIGSLGYWLEQHGVQRGGQPLHYYLVVTTLYEFLPILFALLACRLWLQKNNLNKVIGYWLTAVLGALLAFSLTRWWFHVSSGGVTGMAVNNSPGLIAAVLVLLTAVVYWFVAYYQRLKSEYDLKQGWRGLFDSYALFGIIPYLAWWMFLSWIAYSIAGEKMPWLSTHFIMPMVLLAGWYLNEKINTVAAEEAQSWRLIGLIGLTAVFMVAAVLAIGPLLLDKIQFGDQQINNLMAIGRFLGSILIAAGLFYAVWEFGRPLSRTARALAWRLGLFTVLALLTIRFAYMASFPNADYVTEFLVYAHGAPATKSVVLSQLEELSLRLHGDKSIKVAYDNDSSWPYTWYLRDYPNRIFYGETPGPNITDAPVVLVGSRNWSRVEPYLTDAYDESTYTFLWWPMEKYREISWNAILGDPTAPAEQRRGLGNAAVRQGLWDIFFYRDYNRYGQAFGGNYTAGQWPLRHDLKMFIRKDVAARFWDYGAGGVVTEPAPDPYAENVLELAPMNMIGEFSGGPATGQLLSPRNLAIGPDGNLYVADSGNHRIQVFDPNGFHLRVWGSFGDQPGQFNEPWGVAVDENFVYVADTWNHRIQKFTLEGQFVAVFGRSGSPPPGEVGGGLFFGPRDILLLSADQLLVTDTGNHRMQILDTNGNFIEQVGAWGNQPGQLNEPVGLALGPDGSVYVADTWNARVQRFAPNLLPFTTWSIRGWRSDSINNKPYLAVDNAGRVYVTDPESFRVLIFDSEGNYLARFGRFGEDITGLGLPNGIKVDAAGNIYVADAGNHRILQYAPIFPPALENVLPGEGLLEENTAGDQNEIDPTPAP
jgi:DNA-binding beta-propeller fold protein YncE